MTLRSKIPQTITAIDHAADRQAFKIANNIRNEGLHLILRTTKSGRQYRNHIASAPGQAPASDTGRLVQSLRVEHQPGTKTARVVAGTKHAYLLEFGTATMRSRPFMRPAVANVVKRGLGTGFEIKVE